MEQCDLTIPITPTTLANYQVTRLLLDWYGQFIEITLRGSNGEVKTHTYSGSIALTLIRQLNTANFSTISLHKRIMNRLVTDGVITGAVSGSPD